MLEANRELMGVLLKRLILTIALTVFPIAGAFATTPLDFVFENHTFARNLEWGELGERLKGQTFIGDIAKPYFTYKIQDNITVDAGAVLNMPFGEDGRVQSTDPLLSLHYNLAPGWRINMGTIDWRHPLLNSIYSEFQEYIRPVGQGFQFQGNTKYIRQDTWIDWEQKELPNRKEKFAVGNYTQLKYAGFMADAQVLWNHSGGQLNTNSGGGVVNNNAYAFGGGYSVSPRRMNKKLWYFDEIGADFHYVGSNDKPHADAPASREQGTLSRIFGRAWDTDVHFMYWHGGNNFVTTKGSPIYQAATDLREIGIEKTWWLSNQVTLTAGYKGQFIMGTFQHVDLIEARWWVDLPMFPDYFNNLEDTKSSPRKLLKGRSPSFNTF